MKLARAILQIKSSADFNRKKRKDELLIFKNYFRIIVKVGAWKQQLNKFKKIILAIYYMNLLYWMNPIDNKYKYINWRLRNNS